MRLAIEQESSLPTYRQIVDYVSRAILSGRFETDMRLPSIRKLSADPPGVSRITVENACARLEADGLVGSRVGSGTFVPPVYDTQIPYGSEDSPAWPHPSREFLERCMEEGSLLWPAAGTGSTARITSAICG